jgi:GH15 family glucan-1,4-alpha-glucosidase
MYGEMVTTVWLDADDHIDDGDWRFLSGVVEEAIRRWREPDHGIWESRGPPRHYVHSKALCWLAVNRGLELAKRLGRLRGTEHWPGERDAIRASIEAQGVDPQRGCFVQAYGSRAVDASLLRLPLVGFVAPNDPRLVATVAAIRSDLEVKIGDGSFLRRYKARRGTAAPAADGAFLLCSFWLADVLAMQGNLVEARSLFERLLAYRNDLGLLPEELDPQSGEFLGNFPQAFSHMAIITTAYQLQEDRDPAQRQRPVAERLSNAG